MKISPTIWNNKYQTRVYTLLIFYILIVLILMVYAINIMKQDYFDSIGQRALSIAIVNADSIKLSNAEVRRLEKLDLNGLIKDPLNVKFETLSRTYMQKCGIKYIYVLRKLPLNQVRYSVEQQEEDYYQLPKGTPLNTEYLLDMVVSDQVRLQDTDNQGYTDKDRFTFLSQDIDKIYNNKESTYAIYNDEWGAYITGFAPVYSIEGEYVGLLGVDIYLNEYISIARNRMIMVVFFGLMTTLTVFFLFRSFKRLYKTEEKANFFKEMSYIDYMTGFLNRRTLNEHATEYWNLALKQKTLLTVMMLDIDHFKTYNDQYGHSVGDEMILKITSTIKLCTRENQDLHFRYGGDELLVLFFDTETSLVKLIAERILESVGNLSIDGIDERITLSIGISCTIPQKDSNLTQLIEKADQALYQSKQKGRNCINVYNDI